MSKFDGIGKKDAQTINVFGNAAVAHEPVGLGAAGQATAIGDLAYVMTVPAGAKVYDLKAVFPNLGAGVTLSMGYESVDGTTSQPTAFVNGQVASAAGTVNAVFSPVYFDRDTYVTVTVGGAAVGTPGTVDVIAEYINKGTL